jgi:hypothetical protein
MKITTGDPGLIRTLTSAGWRIVAYSKMACTLAAP